MKPLLSLSLIAFLFYSCSGSKEITTSDTSTKFSTIGNKYYYKKSFDSGTDYPKNKIYKPQNSTVVYSEKISKTVNKIIQLYTGNPITQIARSDIYKTKIGYEWKFTNVNTGQSYKIETNPDFKNVQVKTLTSISDF